MDEGVVNGVADGVADHEDSVVQGFYLVLLKVMLFRERIILSLEQNNLSHFFTDMDPFDGQYIKVAVTIFSDFLFMCLKNGQKSKNQKNTWEKSIILACHTDFALKK